MKNKIFKIALTTALVAAITLPAYANSLSDLQRRQQENQQQQQATRALLNETRRERNIAVSEMEVIGLEMTEASERLVVINDDLERTEVLHAQTQEELENAVADRERQFDLFQERVRFMYMRGQSGYLEAILNARNFVDLINRIEYINRIIAHDQNILDRLTEAEERVETALTQIATQKAEIRVLQNHQMLMIESLEEMLAEQNLLFEQLSQQEAGYARLLATEEEASRQIDALIQAEVRRQAAAQAAAPRAHNQPFTGGRLDWPVPARSYISSGYGWRTIFGRREFHAGIDIPAPHGTRIVAAADGVVTHAGWMGGFGNTVLIHHAELGVFTLYGHASSLDVRVGQRVNSGDTIARVGSTGRSTGNHLHFEVRTGGGTTNPIPFLRG